MFKATEGCTSEAFGNIIAEEASRNTFDKCTEEGWGKFEEISTSYLDAYIAGKIALASVQRSERQHQLAKLIIEDRNGEKPTCSCCGEAINERDDIDMLDYGRHIKDLTQEEFDELVVTWKWDGRWARSRL
jgi:hypothetical protein